MNRHKLKFPKSGKVSTLQIGKIMLQIKTLRSLASTVPQQMLRILLLSFLMVGIPFGAHADLDILVIGSTHSFSEGGESGVVHEKAFDPSVIAAELQSILAGDPAITETVQVVFEDIYQTKTLDTNIGSGGTVYSFNYRCYSLAQYYMWPEGRAARLANLRGANGTAWDYIVIMGDPYQMANMPGMFAEGIEMLVREINQGTAQPILFAQWPENSSGFTANQFNEVVYRAGDSAGVAVVPGGLAWENLVSQDVSPQHPSPHGAYLAAASVYSELYDKSAKTSIYTYNDAIADHALDTVQATASVAQYTGNFTANNVFAMKYVYDRHINYNHTGTSSENGIQGKLNGAFNRCKVSYTKYGSSGSWPAGLAPIDFNYGRGNDWFEDNKDYHVDPSLYDRSYGFPMQDYFDTAPTTMPYGIDKRYWNGSQYEDGTDMGIAYNMIRPGTRELGLPLDVRAIPTRLMWTRIFEVAPSLDVVPDGTHMNSVLLDAIGTYIYTLQSGRCPVTDEPAPQGSSAWQTWFGQKTGYETAWRLSHGTTRAPGFQVLPSSSTATNVTPSSAQSLSVRFMMPPKSNVTVSVTTDDPLAGKVSPATLTFTPANYNEAQTVTVTGESGLAGTYAFDVVLSANSGDPVYEAVVDKWNFSNTRPDGPAPSTIRILGKGVSILSGTTSSDPSTGTDFGVTSGTVSQQFTITNISTSSTINLTDMPRVTVTDTGGHFTLSQDAAIAAIGPKGSTTFTVDFTPLVGGTHTALVSVASSDVIVPVYTFSLAGIRADAPTVMIGSATSTVPTRATVSGTLTDGGVAEAWICWGPSDGGVASTVDWANVVYAGSAIDSLPFSSVVEGLETNVTYWFRCFVSNAIGSDWSDSAVHFSGRPFGAVVGGGDPVMGADIYLHAGLDDGANATWEDSLGVWNLTLDTDPEVSYVASPGSAFSGITAAYDFPGGTGGNGGGIGTSFGSMGGWDLEPVSIEIWFKPDATSDDGASNGQVLWETGGTTGLGIFYNDGTLEVGHDSNEVISSVDVSALANDFIQVVVTYDETDFLLYVNGALAGSGSKSDTDWSGTDQAGLGARAQSNVGGRGAGDSNTVSFEGMIAVFRAYRNQILSGEEVMTNFRSLAGSVAPVANLAPTGISTNAATFNAQLNAGRGSYDVYVHWGTVDGGTNREAWAFSRYVGAWTNVVATVNYAPSGLAAGSTYYYTFRAEQEGSNSWGETSWQFTLPGDSAAVTANHLVPHAWLSEIDDQWSVDYEAAVLADQDGDGFFTWEEYWSGTDPVSSNSHLRVETVLLQGGDVTLEWQHEKVAPGLPDIQIETCTNLVDGAWTTVETYTPANGTNFWSGTYSPSPDVYFRLVVPNAP